MATSDCATITGPDQKIAEKKKKKGGKKDII